MDKLKNLAGGAGGSAEKKEGSGSAGNEDYVDKVSLPMSAVARQLDLTMCTGP